MSEAEQTGAARQDKGERLLAGRYRLQDVLGRGGMGTVWRAQDETLGRQVAVKELRFPSSIDDDDKRRLITRTLREAKAIARIRNTSAVTVYDVVDEDDRPWIVMELIEGKSLADVIRHDGVLAPRRAAEVGLAILDVLRSAHREGILHRDVKPSNVLISEDGRVVLTDFGIAQVEGDPSITSTGMLVGAPSYISPERARGHKPGPAADLWSLGGLLYAAVEGGPPYDKGTAIATLTAVMTEPVEPPKNAGDKLAEVIYGLLVKDPARRLDDAGARALLTAIVRGPEPEPAPPADRSTHHLRMPPLPTRPPGDAVREAAARAGRGSRRGTGGSRSGSRSGAGAGGAASGAAAGAALGSEGAAGAAGGSGSSGSAGSSSAAAAGSAGSAAAGSAASGSGSAGVSASSGAGAASGGRRSEEVAERLRGALRAVRRAAGGSGEGRGRSGSKSGTAEGSSGRVPPPPMPSAPPAEPRPADRGQPADVARTAVLPTVGGVADAGSKDAGASAAGPKGTRASDAGSKSAGASDAGAKSAGVTDSGSADAAPETEVLPKAVSPTVAGDGTAADAVSVSSLVDAAFGPAPSAAKTPPVKGSSQAGDGAGAVAESGAEGSGGAGSGGSGSGGAAAGEAGSDEAATGEAATGEAGAGAGAGGTASEVADAAKPGSSGEQSDGPEKSSSDGPEEKSSDVPEAKPDAPEEKKDPRKTVAVAGGTLVLGSVAGAAAARGESGTGAGKAVTKSGQGKGSEDAEGGKGSPSREGGKGGAGAAAKDRATASAADPRTVHLGQVAGRSSVSGASGSAPAAAVAGAAATAASESPPATPASSSQVAAGAGAGAGGKAGGKAPIGGVSRRTLVIAAVIVALAVLGTVLGLALRDDSGGTEKDSGDKNSSAGASSGGSGTGGKGDETGQGDGSDQGNGGTGGKTDGGTGEGGEQGEDAGEGHDPGRTGGSGPGGGGIEDTVTRYRHEQGFSIGLPRGWKYTSTNAAGAHFQGPRGQKLLIGWTSTPKDNPVSDWRNQEQYMRRSEYQRIRIEAVGFRGWETADWEFTYVDNGVKYRTIDRGFVVSSRLGYALMYTAKDADWDTDQRRDTWRTFTRTFTPKS